MLTKGSALNVGKGWAVASLFRKARENRQAKFYLKSAGAFLIALTAHRGPAVIMSLRLRARKTDVRHWLPVVPSTFQPHA